MPVDDNGTMLPNHQYVDVGQGHCFVCGFDENDQLHEEQSENELVGEQASWPGLPPEVVRRLRRAYWQAADFGKQLEQARVKPKKGKHHFVHPDKLGQRAGTAGFYGPGLCAACGQPSDDPDHDGDVDAISLADIDVDAGGGSADSQMSAAAAGKKPEPPAGFQAESEVIKRNKDTPQANQPHRFQPAEFTHPNGHPRCLMCGQDEPSNGVCQSDDPNGQDIIPDMPGNRSIPIAAAEDTETTKAYTITSVRERAPIPQLQRPEWKPDSPGFVTEVNGKTIITAKATVDPTLFEKAFSPNEFFLWTQGRLVGADQANRNGAFWTSGDLELGQATVKYGPLNWLHDGKHVIGTLAEGAFTGPPEQAGDMEFAQPHIAVVAPVWKWLYPDEADVIQMASDADKFWYSMECVSKSVQCVGEGSCGAEVAYLDYIQNKGDACEHMVQRSATRRFADPTFLGAAVIVPPVRPGWAEANASVMKQAASMAEKAYDQAGKPAVSASDWEQLMAQVLGYANA